MTIAVVLLLSGVGVALGVAVALVLLLRGVVLGLWPRSSDVTPQTYREQRDAARPRQLGDPPRDLAWPVWFLQQGRTDVATVIRITDAAHRRLAMAWADTFVRGKHGSTFWWWLFLPAPVVTGLALVVQQLTLWATFLLLVLLLAAMVLPLLLLWLVVIGLLRLLDAVWAQSRNAEASCPGCAHVSPRPAYRCPGCSELHRDVRAGALGAVYRRCDCGALLSTTVVRAARSLTAVCQRCGSSLVAGSGSVRDVRVPVFGDAGAGKTKFLHAALAGIFASDAPGRKVAFADEFSTERGIEACSQAQTGSDGGLEPQHRAITCRIGTGATATLLHTFDASGQRWRDADREEERRFLERGHALVYVVNPFALPAVRRQLPAPAAAEQLALLPPDPDPESAYGRVVARVRDAGVPARSQSLAVVVTRADLMAQHGLPLPDGDADVSAWLHESGLHNVVLAAPRDFAAVRYFVVASLSPERSAGANDPSEPLRWMLGTRGLDLPAREVTAGADA